MISTGPLTQAELDALRCYDTCTIANAIETFDIRPRTAGFMSPEIRCVFPGMGVMLGYAVTGRCRASEKTEATYSRHGWWDAIAAAPAPRVAVLQDVDDPPVGSFWGEVQSNIHTALGCVGCVTNGGVRDLNEVEPLGFQYYAGSVMVSHAYINMIDYGMPVTIGGVEIATGDLIHADRHGVQTIPLEIAREIPAACERIMAKEQVVISLCRSRDFSLEALKTAQP
ncbi:MAG: RraA family protein [Candidatus Velthaea sp.]